MAQNIDEKRQNLTAADKGHQEKNGPQGPLPRYALLPGDPNRIALMASQWDEGAKHYVLDRAQCCAVGAYKGADLCAYSTGIGGPSTEPILTDLCNDGVDTFIRVGTTGAIQEDIKIGDIIINDSNVRYDGTSNFYMPAEYPASANYEVVAALVQACENLGFTYHVGTGCTCGSFYTGQCRTTYGGYRPSHLDDMFSDLKNAGVLNFEMEGAAIMTMARVFGKRAAMCATVVAQRITGEWDDNEGGQAKSCLVGAEAVRILHEWDAAKAAAGKKYFFPGLLK